MVIYIVKSLKTLSLEKLIMKCRNDTYEELIDIDLIEKCHHGQLLQQTMSLFVIVALSMNIQDMKR